MDKPNIEFDGENIAYEKLPKPAGWRILIGSVRIADTSAGGIIMTESRKEIQEYGRFVARILAVGSECYNHEKFQGGISIKEREPAHWAKVGDYVIVGQHSGQDVPVYEDGDGKVVKLKLLNDDEILAVVPKDALSTIVFN